MKRLLLEALGSFFITFTLMITENDNPLAVGLMIVTFLYLSRGILKTQFNPAISLTFALTGHLHYAVAILHIVSQLIGSIVAGLFFGFVYSQSFSPGMMIDISLMTAIFWEAILTMIICWVSLTTAKEKDPVHSAGIIGLAYIATFSFGGLFNPSIIFGSLASGLRAGIPTDIISSFLLVFFCAPFIGSLLAVGAHTYFHQVRE